ncbi:unnamed protein product [Sphenostylis stenocarpa]|uniref:Uncharacterized protein n=1 Tax=Sphenostylis stenocarpa TaxID=92480 RepID=A0AA86VUF9_9FABA|nr:unnamed protein product [Sphenostylis stenocarpa]
MEESVHVTERILGYKFNNRKLLEEALTHSSFTEGVSYERLEFIGDPILSLAISNYLFLAYPHLHPGHLSLLRAANISTEKLARVAVRHGLYRFIRHSAPPLMDQIERFANAVALENQAIVVYGGSVKAPKVLADIVESIAGAIYVDLGYDLEELWRRFRGILEPIVTPGDLEQQPQPVTALFEICQKRGKDVDIKQVRKGAESVASVFVDGQFIASASSVQKDLAKLEAAKIALDRLAYVVPPNSMKPSGSNMQLSFCPDKDGTMIIEAAKHRLHEFCENKKWPKPVYRIEKDSGPSHEKRFVCAVEITTEEEEQILQMSGDEKSRVKDAENSAASLMLMALLGAS